MTVQRPAVRGAAWNAFSTGLFTLLHVVQTIVLAHFLDPGLLGLAAMPMVAVTVFQTMADLGFSSPVIHRQETSQARLSSLYWMALAAGALLSIGLAVLGPAVAAVFDEPRAAALTAVAAPLIVIGSAGRMFQAVLEQHLRFHTLAFVEMAGNVAAFAATVLGAVYGWGITAVFAGLYVGAAVTCVGLVGAGLSLFRPSSLPRLEHLRGYGPAGLLQMGERLVNNLGNHVDRILVGRYLGAHALGIYTLAFQLVAFPLQRVSPLVVRVLLPALARLRSDVRATVQGYSYALKALALATFPLMLGMAAVSHLFVPLFFGAAWQPAVALVGAFCLVGVVRALTIPIGILWAAHGRFRTSFAWMACASLLTFALLRAGVAWGLPGVAAAFAVQAVLLYGFLVIRRPGMAEVPRAALVGPALKPLLAAAAMAIVVRLAEPFVGVGLGGAERLGLLVLLGMAVYVPLAAWMERAFIVWAWNGYRAGEARP